MDKENYALLTGLFLTILIGVTIAISFWIGNMHEPRNNYTIATRDAVSGLTPDSTVFYRGIAAGKVKKIFFDPEDPRIILIPIEIDKKITLTRGVVATLRMKGVTGLTQIELKDTGSTPEILPPDTDRIILRPSLIERLSSSGETMLEKTNQLLTRLNHILDDNSEQQIKQILGNVETASSQLITLETQASDTLKAMPALTEKAKATLTHVDELTTELIPLSKQIITTTHKIDDLVETSTIASNIVVTTTLPQLNVLLTELQSTIRDVKQVAALLKNDPQALLLGPGAAKPGPGEAGFKEATQ